MFIELIDLLRCPADHPETWLVAAFQRMEGRFVLEGTLGCPECSAMYPIAGGVADLSSSPIAPSGRALPAGEDEVIRYAAMLGLSRPGSLVILTGRSAALAEGLVAMTECRIIACNPPENMMESERIALVRCDKGILPVASGAAHALVWESEPDFSEAARVLRPGGRIVLGRGPLSDARFRELARDDRHVVAERGGELVSLRR